MRISAFTMLFVAVAWLATPAFAQTKEPPAKPKFEGTMTLQIMGEIVKKLDDKSLQRKPGTWQLTVDDRPVVVITDVLHDRMRILVPVARAADLTGDQLLRIAQANFDTALDSRYAIAQNILWSVYIHPLQELHRRQFITAIGQTVNLAVTFGTTYSSGALSYGGGDSNELLRRKLIDDLLKKGQDI